jgi:RNA polymerase primary sigma factor
MSEKGQSVRDRLILENQPLIFFIAKKYARCGVPFSDLIQEGNIGILKSIDTFDPKKGTFGNHAFAYVFAYIIKAIQKNRLVHVPFHRQEQNRKDGGDPFGVTVNIDDTPNLPSQHDVFEEVAQGEVRKIVGKLLHKLPLRDRAIVALRFGIGDGNDHTLEEIGRQFDLTKERVRQIIKNALATLAKGREITGMKEAYRD